MLKVAPQNQRAEKTTIRWAIWKARNKLVSDQKHPQLNVVIFSAMQYFVNSRNAQVCSTTDMFPNPRSGNGACSSIKPHESIIHVTVDASTFSEQNAFGFGMIVKIILES